MFGREFPSKTSGESLSWYIFQDTNVKWRAEKFVYTENMPQIFFHIGYGFPEIIPFPVPLPLILLEKNF